MHEATVGAGLEVELREPTGAATLPGRLECLVCYVARMLEESGCDRTLRWSQLFREARSPTATGLEHRLSSLGGACDCGIFRNGLRLARHAMVRDVHTDELELPAELPDCPGVRRTSTHRCPTWERRRRG